MDKLNLVLIAMLVVCSGCSSSSSDENSERRAEEHITLARALESDARWSEAVREYVIVAEHYPRTSHYQTAVRKVAILYSHPLANDSASLQWLRVYAGLPLSEETRDNVEAQIRLFERLDGLIQLIALRDSTVDSLATVVKDQQARLVTKSREIKDIELELSLTRQELEKLREIDIEVGREKEKEQP